MNTNKIAELNDKLRQNIFHSGKDKVVLAREFSLLPFDEQLRILTQVKEFKDFNEGNNPYGQRDFGKIEHNGEDYFFKIDYYDNDLVFGSEKPEDENITTRVLTVMKASEY